MARRKMRQKLSKKVSRKVFKRNSGTHKRNNTGFVMRGGTRM